MVEDDKDILYTFNIYLKSLGYSTVSFDNPIEALDYYNTNIINCILVITDYGMPHMSGLDLLEKIREKDLDYKIKTIVISATVKKDIINYNDKFLKLKIDKFLKKPISFDKFAYEVKMLIK